ncbi:hypothetical protein [Chitinophaga sancti]|uniref:Uncharacterized protein n=1 Tax=Chitinophaga sancti TaxID=1004 RepID=A0A1K1T2B3_9BACT|nr:hypothetical protein [Chitinophaga sancti]WQD59552.1 hypothetical protein U0033_16790 [Chitinophaga sancti]WQG88314.1 hypothetical protein SR876_25675 [Chitinophaga sancti]SFW90644.1 hypothetical protein SAMN05661012_06650 [Chitinophaga sancti]
MKKVNIILSVIGLLSIIGGTLAFKSQHRFGGTLFCYTTIGTGIDNSFTPILVTRYTTVNPHGTLFCTVPGANVFYHPLRVTAAL